MLIERIVLNLERGHEHQHAKYVLRREIIAFFFGQFRRRVHAVFTSCSRRVHAVFTSCCPSRVGFKGLYCVLKTV